MPNIIITVFEGYDADDVLKTYPLPFGNFCKPIEGIRKNDDGSITGYAMVMWDGDQVTAEHIDEIVNKNGRNYTNAKYISWLKKNPLELDKNGVPIITDATNLIESILKSQPILESQPEITKIETEEPPAQTFVDKTITFFKNLLKL